MHHYPNSKYHLVHDSNQSLSQPGGPENHNRSVKSLYNSYFFLVIRLIDKKLIGTFEAYNASFKAKGVVAWTIPLTIIGEIVPLTILMG